MKLTTRQIAKLIVHNRLRVQRGIAFVAMFVSTLTAVGVWRSYFPPMPWYIQIGIGALLYLLFSWVIGLMDEKFLWRVENERQVEMNPPVVEMLERLRRIEEKLNEQTRL